MNYTASRIDDAPCYIPQSYREGLPVYLQQAHAILDRVQDGQSVGEAEITHALEMTGDIE